MTNKEMIMSIFSSKKEECEKLINRLSNNFLIDSDEYSFKSDFRIYQPMLEIGEKLINDGKAELIGNIEHKRHEIKINIVSECKVGGMWANIRLDTDGDIAAVTVRGDENMRHGARKLVQKWLTTEFGKAVYG